MIATLFSSNMFLSSSRGTCSLCSRKPGESFHCCSSVFVYSLLRREKTFEGRHIAVAHDFFIAVNTKDRLGIFWSHLAENQAFRLQLGKLFLVGAFAHAFPPQHAHRFLRLPMPRSGNSSRSKYGLHHSPTSSPSMRRELSPRRWQPRQENEMPSFFICSG